MGDEKSADERDFAFFARVVSGITERRGSSTSTISASSTAANSTTQTTRYIEDTDRCLTHIIQTRHHNQSHDQQEEAQHDGILIEEDYSPNQVGVVRGGEVSYLRENLDYFAASSSSS